MRILASTLALALLLLPRAVHGQAVTGTIFGTVTDNSGAVMPGVTVTVTNIDTSRSRTYVTDGNGEYTAPSVQTGTYKVGVELQGFKGVVVEGITVSVDQRVRVDARLELGNMSETVEIIATTPLVQVSSSDLSTTVDEEQIKALPLNGRNFVSLTRTVPGVMRGIPGSNIDGAGSLAWRASAAFSANGQRPRDNNYMLDGVDNNETWLQTVVIFPSVDALDEFKLQTSTYSAEFGRSLGGVVNLQLKSGSNQYRGSAFEFYRNDAFDANNFFNNRAGRPKPDFQQNQFGGTIGGHIIRDRTFFFTDYQGLRINAGQTFLSTVPSMKMRAGDFSEINRVIYDPLTQQPFPGNVIPGNRFDPASAQVMQRYYPEPNTAGSISATGQQINNYLINPELTRNDDQFDVKVDHVLTQANRFFGRYSYQKTLRDLPASLPLGDAGTTFGAGKGDIKAQSFAFNDTHTFGTNWLNEARFGWNSIKFFMTPIGYLTNPAAAVGIPGINLNDATSAMTQLGFQTIRNMGANGNQPLITNQNDFQFFDNVTWLKGKHTIKVGGSLTLRSREILNADTIVGNFAFTNNQTSNCAGLASGCTINANTGLDVASFLLGFATSKTRNLFDAETYTEQRPEYALYVHDDFRVSNRLTLNLGLRWDVFVPWIEKDDRQSNFDETTGQFILASDNAVLEGVEVGRYLQTYSKKDFAPRLGFAYDVSGDARLVVRGGFGVFWNFTPGGTSSSKAQNPPFLQSTALTTNVGQTTLRVQDGLPPPPGVDPSRPAAGTTRSIFDIYFRDGFARNWNLNVQKQFGTNYMVELAYVGSQGRNMLLKGDPNQAPPVVGVTDQNVNRPYAAVSPALRSIGQVQSTGTLDYNGFFIKVQRRFADNFSMLNSYTWNKVIDLNSDNDGGVTLTNVYDPQYNRGPADYDVTHTLSSSWVYELPIGRGHWYGGWQTSGILYLRSGLPFTVTQTQGVQSTGTGNRPNRLADGAIDNPTIERWFDTSAFVAPADVTGTYGDAGRNILRGPGQFNIDFSVIKSTRIGRVNTEFRVEAFNLLNHPQFAQPNGTLGNPLFGQITAMLPNPSCALCGTTERNIQVAMKVTF
ncbi:TonB-dependent receptor [Luteitalea pratensis]|uniref:TonB-dependent receptor n=1 Tax=Luteitalea pratensis TaxID=1855912 RepID=UPI0012FF83AC|nr:carboxypeptidase-like regulatory domain-containing protein [Luteitalea pratensis]